MSTWPPPPPPIPPLPFTPPPRPEPPPAQTPWQPEWRPTIPAPSVVIHARRDRLSERLLDRRIVTLAGRLGPEATNQAVAALALLDASGDDPIELRLHDPHPDTESELDTVLTLLDAIDLLAVPLHATCLGGLTGALVTVLAIADHRSAGAHSIVTLRQPRTQLHGFAAEVTAAAEHHQRRLHGLQQRLADACARPLESVSDDMRAGRVLTADQARDYGLIDRISSTTPPPP